MSYAGFRFGWDIEKWGSHHLKTECVLDGIWAKIGLWLLSNWMEYGRSDGISLDYKPIGIPFVSYTKGRLSLRCYSIQFESKWKTIIPIVQIWLCTSLSPFSMTKLKFISMHFINSIPSCKYNKEYKPLQIEQNYIYPKYFVLQPRTLSIGTKEQKNLAKGCS